MTLPPPNLQVLAQDGLACIKVTGRANFTLSASLDRLLTELQRKKFQCFVLELSNCSLMDSSFLGILVGFAAKLRGLDGGDAPSPVELRNLTPVVRQLFDDLGVLDLFHITEGAAVDTGCATQTVVAGESSKVEITRACLAAHRALMAEHPENVSRFKDVTRFLAEDLKKLQGGAS